MRLVALSMCMHTHRFRGVTVNQGSHEGLVQEFVLVVSDLLRGQEVQFNTLLLGQEQRWVTTEAAKVVRNDS